VWTLEIEYICKHKGSKILHSSLVPPHALIISYGQEGAVPMAAENKLSLKHLYFGRHGNLEICRWKILSRYLFVTTFVASSTLQGHCI